MKKTVSSLALILVMILTAVLPHGLAAEIGEETIICITDEASSNNLGFEETSGTWNGSANATLGIHYVNPDTGKSLARYSSGGAATATIRAQGLTPGRYRFYYFISGYAADAATVNVEVMAKEGAAKTVINLQDATKKGFYCVGEYNFDQEAVVNVSSEGQLRFSAAKFEYMGETELSIRDYTLDTANQEITGVPEGTTVEEFLSHISVNGQAKLSVQNRDGAVKTQGQITGGDQLVIEKEAINTAYTIYTSLAQLNGLYAEENFDQYQNWTQFQRVTTKQNPSAVGNQYASENTYQLNFVSQGDGQYLSIGSQQKETAQILEPTLLGMREASGKILVSFDYMQDGFAGGWMNFKLGFEGYPSATQIFGYSDTRGTLSRNAEKTANPSANWLLPDGQKLLPQSGQWQNMKFFLDLEDTKTITAYYNDVPVGMYSTEDPATAQLRDSVSTGDWNKALQFGFDRQLDPAEQKGTVNYDNIRIYEPASYAAALEETLPAKIDISDDGAVKTVQKLREVVNSGLLVGYTEGDFPCLSTLTAWENAIASKVEKINEKEIGTRYYEDFQRYTDVADYEAKTASEAETGKTNQYLTDGYSVVTLEEGEEGQYLSISNTGTAPAEPVHAMAKLYNASAQGKFTLNFRVYRSADNNTWFKVYGMFSGYSDATTGDTKEIFSFNPAGEMISRDASGTAAWLYNGEEKALLGEGWHDICLLFDTAQEQTLRVFVDQKEYTYQIGSENKEIVPIGNIGNLEGYGYLRQLEKGNVHKGSVGLDDIRIFTPDGPIKAALAALPANAEAAMTEDGKHNVLAAQALAQEAQMLGVDVQSLEGYDTLQRYLALVEDRPIEIASDVYTVEEGKISGVLYGTSIGKMMENITVPYNCSWEVLGKSETDSVESGDVLRVYKTADPQQQKEYTIDAGLYFTADSALALNREEKIIGAIPYGTAVESFLALLSFSPSVTMTVYTGESVNTGTVQSGDILKVSAEGEEKETYTLQVVAPSADNTIVSVGAYTLEGETIKNVPYGTTLDEFKSNITLPFGATAVYPYADDYQGAIENNMEFRVVAQNGAEKVYTVQVNPGRSDSALESDVYTVDPVALSIGKVKVGTDVGEFLANIRASEGGEIRLMDSKMQQMTAGQLTGGESVRVYPEDPVPGKAYTAYVIQYEEEKQILEETIITLQDSSCVLTGDWLESSSAVEPGYGPITLPKYLNGAGSAVFTPEITQAGVYDVYIYTSYHSSNPAVTMKVMQGETELGNALIDFAQPSGWKLVGSYELTEGAQVSLVYDGNRLSESGFARFSAARFARADLLEMEKVTLQVNESNYDLKSGISVSGVLPEPGEVQITFPAEMDEKTLENIALVSENGYPIDCGRSYDAESKTYTMTTAYSLVRGVAYYLQIPSTVKTAAGSSLSAPYMYQMNTMPKEYDATAQIIYYRDGAVASSTIGGAVKAKVNLSFGNHTDGEKTAQVFVAYYESNKLGAIEMLSITAAADGSGKGECEIDFQHVAQESDKLKVFVWDGENAPLAEVVYTK